jgi:hypothetical protein
MDAGLFLIGGAVVVVVMVAVLIWVAMSWNNRRGE